MEKIGIDKILTYSIALVWVLNGLFCKILNVVPRHEEIVERVLGTDFSRPLTVLIGVLEIGMGIWVLTEIKPKFNAVAQILIVLSMNILEFFLAPDLLLWGKMNALFAFLFIFVIYFKQFYFNKKGL